MKVHGEPGLCLPEPRDAEPGDGPDAGRGPALPHALPETVLRAADL